MPVQTKDLGFQSLKSLKWQLKGGCTCMIKKTVGIWSLKIKCIEMETNSQRKEEKPWEICMLFFIKSNQEQRWLKIPNNIFIDTFIYSLFECFLLEKSKCCHCRVGT